MPHQTSQTDPPAMYTNLLQNLEIWHHPTLNYMLQHSPILPQMWEQVQIIPLPNPTPKGLLPQKFSHAPPKVANMISSSNTLKVIAEPRNLATPHSEPYATTLLHPPPSARTNLNHPHYTLHTSQPNTEGSLLPWKISHASPNIANIAAPLPQPLGTNFMYSWDRNPVYNQHHEFLNPHQPPHPNFPIPNQTYPQNLSHFPSNPPISYSHTRSPYSEFSDYRPFSSHNSPSFHTNLSPESTPTSFHSQTPSLSTNGFEDFYGDDDNNDPQDQDQQEHKATQYNSEENDVYKNQDFYSGEDDQYGDNNYSRNDYELTNSNEDDWDCQ